MRWAMEKMEKMQRGWKERRERLSTKIRRKKDRDKDNKRAILNNLKPLG